MKEKSQRDSLRLNIKKLRSGHSASLTAWQTEGEKVEVVTDFPFLGFKITADCDLSHEIRRQLLLGRKAMTNLHSMLKSRHYSADMVHVLKAMVFPVVMYGCENRTIKEVEHQRINVFKLWCWRGLLKVLWTAKRSDQFSSVQLLSRGQLFVIPWSAACQASLSVTNSWSLLTHVHWVGDAIQPPHPLLSPSPTFNLSQH